MNGRNPMFKKDTKFAFEKTRPTLVWTGKGWREDRRHQQDSYLGRRSSDAHFPYNPSFVAQALAEGEQGAIAVSRTVRYNAADISLRGRFVKLSV
jgi:hypothetical protein